MEKKVNENIDIVEDKEIVRTESEVKGVKLFIERESFVGNSGDTYWSYVLKGKVLGRDVTVNFVPKDKGGYLPLDIVFSISPKVELFIGEGSMTDKKGKITKYSTYKVRTIGEDKNVYECSIKPRQDSDKSLLSMVLNNLKLGITLY